MEQSGNHHSLNLNVRGIGYSPTLAIAERCRALTQAGTPVFNFGLGQSPFPVPAPVVAALRLHAPEKDYLPVRGLPALREAVAAFHRRTDCVDAQAELVLVGPGSKELMFLMQVVFYGELLLPSPCWVSYGPQARILGKQIRVLHTRFEERWHLRPERLERFLQAERDQGRPRILVLNYPGNPEGLTYTNEELQALAAVAARHELLILSDEIYGQLHHRGEHVSIARFYPEGTIISSGISKWCGAGGWRLGTMTFPPALAWLLEAMAFVASETYTSVSAPIQYAAIHAFQGGVEIERYLRQTRRILAGLGRRLQERLCAAGLRVHAPEGGFYLLIDFGPLRERLLRRGVEDAATLCERLLGEAHVAVLPGTVFEQPADALTARLSYINFNGGQVLTAGEAIAPHEELDDEFFARHCPDALAGVEQIAAWVAAL